MCESLGFLRSVSHPSDASRDVYEGDPIRALRQSVSFGRFVSETSAWDRWSSVSHNRYLEEARRFSKPGSVAQKKAQFEAHYRQIEAKKKGAAIFNESNAQDSNGATGCHIDLSESRLVDAIIEDSKSATSESMIQNFDQKEISEQDGSQAKAAIHERSVSTSNRRSAVSSSFDPAVLTPQRINGDGIARKPVEKTISTPGEIQESVDVAACAGEGTKSSPSGNSGADQISMEMSQGIMNEESKHPSVCLQSETRSPPKASSPHEYKHRATLRCRMGERVRKFKEFFEKLAEKPKKDAGKMKLQPKAEFFEKLAEKSKKDAGKMKLQPKAEIQMQEETESALKKRRQSSVLEPKPAAYPNGRTRCKINQTNKAQSPKPGKKPIPIEAEGRSSKMYLPINNMSHFMQAQSPKPGKKPIPIKAEGRSSKTHLPRNVQENVSPNLHF